MLQKKGWDVETLKEEEDGKELYHILYATREDSAAFLENLHLYMINQDEDYKDNVEFYHMANAYKYIDSWIQLEDQSHYSYQRSYKKICDAVNKLMEIIQEQ